MTSNAQYLIKLAENYPFVCVQEHWFFRFEDKIFKNLFPNHNVHMKCHDDDDPLPPLEKPNGKYGVAII